jgi:hypothetical protein
MIVVGALDSRTARRKTRLENLMRRNLTQFWRNLTEFTMFPFKGYLNKALFSCRTVSQDSFWPNRINPNRVRCFHTTLCNTKIVFRVYINRHLGTGQIIFFNGGCWRMGELCSTKICSSFCSRRVLMFAAFFQMFPFPLCKHDFDATVDSVFRRINFRTKIGAPSLNRIHCIFVQCGRLGNQSLNQIK